MNKLLFSLLLLSVLASSTLHAAAQEIKLATFARPGAPQRIVAEKFKELLEAESAGKFTVHIDPAGLGTKESEIIAAIQTNTLQMGILTSNAFDTLDPIVRVISFPFLFQRERQAATILDGPLGAAVFRDLETIGCKGLAYSEVGFRNLSNNIRPVKTPDDLNGLKIRVRSAVLPTASWLALGANPTPISWPIYSELEQGIVDGQESPLWIMETYSFFEVQKYLTLTRHSYVALMDVASLKWWETLSRQDQEMMQTAMMQAAVYQRRDQRSKEASRLTLFKEKGMVIEEHPDIETFRNKTVGLKEMALYREPRVRVLLAQMQEAALQTAELPQTIAEEQPEPALVPVEGAPQQSEPALEQTETKESPIFEPNDMHDPFDLPQQSVSPSQPPIRTQPMALEEKTTLEQLDAPSPKQTEIPAPLPLAGRSNPSPSVSEEQIPPPSDTIEKSSTDSNQNKPLEAAPVLPQDQSPRQRNQLPAQPEQDNP